MVAGNPVSNRVSTLIRDLPSAERPRERLLSRGPSSLEDAELLAVILRTGTATTPVLEMARNVLLEAGGISGLMRTDVQTLRVDGIGAARTACLAATLEVARRAARSQLPLENPLRDAAAVARYLDLRFATHDQEVMGAIFLDCRNRVVGEAEIFRGTLNRATVEPRPILRRGLLLSAAGILLFHTHPSGDPTPSAEDLAFTRRMAAAGEVVGVPLVDHLVVASHGRWRSLRERGAW